MKAVRLLFPYLLFAAIGLIVLLDGRRDPDVVHARGDRVATPAEVVDDASGRDPVCNMDVGHSFGVVVDGVRYFFCTARCRETFLQRPQEFLRETCLVCRLRNGRRVFVEDTSPAFTWQGKTFHFCTREHRDAFGSDPAGYFVHSMWGIPTWLYAISVGLILVLSFGLFEVVARLTRGRTTEPARVNLLRRVPGLGALLRWPAFRPLCQIAVVALFVTIIVAGLFGEQIASRNIAPLLTWTVWWGGLVLLILFAGKAWCYVCPWDALAGWLERVTFWRKRKGLGLGLKWPRSLQNIWPATVLFVGLTWLELGFGVTMKPRVTAMLGLLMLLMAFAAALVFERRAFCRYACLVGRVSGLYALFSASEVRPVDRDLCRSCATKDCYHGNEHGDPCPTGLFPATLRENTYCITCMECVKTCPSGNMSLFARPWGADLGGKGRPRRDEAYLALLMLSITGFHGLTMTRAWRDVLAWLETNFGMTYLPAFSLAMLALMAVPVLIYAGLVYLSTRLAGTKGVSFHQAFVRFAYSVLPIALFYHLAHNLEHLLMEGPKVIPLLSNPLGFSEGQSWRVLGWSGSGSWNLLGTADWSAPPWIGLNTLWFVQVVLVLVGHIFSLWVADRTARRLFPAKGAALRSQLPMLVGMVLFSIFSLWLLKQPMEMRTSAM